MKVSQESWSQLQPGMVVILGVPWDENSSYMKGPASAPGMIREALRSDSTNLCAESHRDLSTESRFLDLGDLILDHGDNALSQIEATIRSLQDKEVRVLALGGDHAATYPMLKGYAHRYPKLNILHLDAHPDLYHDFEGNPFSNACPFARIMEEQLATRLVQVGIRTMNPHQHGQAERFSVEYIEMKNWAPRMTFDFVGPVYLSVDMDVLDPAFAPGVSHPEPGGLSTRELLGIIQGVRAPIVGADIVELNPERDPQGITAMAAAKILKEIVSRMLESSP
jgi:agmatinase